MFSIIDRYIAREFLKYFMASLIIFSTLFLAVDMLSRVWQLKAESTVLWQYFLFEIPTIVYRMTPVSCLMATIFTISFLSRTNELTALENDAIDAVDDGTPFELTGSCSGAPILTRP